MPEPRSVCVYCGSRNGTDPIHPRAAFAFGELLARRHIDLVYGGGRVGIMGAVADGALAQGGRVVGVIPRGLVDRELAHREATELVVVDSMHERKAEMERRADAFVALPGGSGTLDELFEVWTWRQLGLHGKPVALLDVAGYWQPLVACLDHMVREGFLDATEREGLLVDADGAALLEAIARAPRATTPRWGGTRA
jgi:uncharacterized protein (TIGR00730 family)